MQKVQALTIANLVVTNISHIFTKSEDMRLTVHLIFSHPEKVLMSLFFANINITT